MNHRNAKCKSKGNCEEDLPKKPVGRLSVNCRPSVDRQSADCWPTVGRVSTNSRPTVGRQSADRRPTDFARNIGYLSADSRPTGFLGSSSSQLSKQGNASQCQLPFPQLPAQTQRKHRHKKWNDFQIPFHLHLR